MREAGTTSASPSGPKANKPGRPRGEPQTDPTRSDTLRPDTKQADAKQPDAKRNASSTAEARANSDASDPAASSSSTFLTFQRADVVAFAVIALLVICVAAVLYVAKAFFLPVVTALIVGTMLSPAAGYFERYRIPRALSAVLIVVLACAAVAFIVGLISSPLIEWSSRLPELEALLKDKLHLFDRPLALWRQFKGMLGESSDAATLPIQMPDVDWFKATLDFLSPTLSEFLLFIATLILFIASWRDLRRALVLMFADRDERLRALKVLNELEGRLGGYLLLVTLINFGVGVATGIVCAVTGMPNPAGLGALAAALNFFPIIGPVAMFVILGLVGIVSFSTLGGAALAPAAFVGLTFLEGHFVTPTIVGRRLELNALAVFVALAFWTWLWGPMGGFLSSPLLIIALILKDYLRPAAVGGQPLPQ